MKPDDNLIRELAYQIWESEGKPDGHDQRHWEMAYKLADSHSTSTGQLAAILGEKSQPGDLAEAQQRYGNDTFGQPIAAYDKPAASDEEVEQFQKKTRTRAKTSAVAMATDTHLHETEVTGKKPTKPRKSKTAAKAELITPPL